MDRYLMISQDCHAGAPWFIYRKYLDPQYREEHERWVTGVIGDISHLDQTQMDKQVPTQYEANSAAPRLETTRIDRRQLEKGRQECMIW